MDNHHNIEYIAPSDLTPYKGNARTHSKKQLKQIQKSIARFGFTNPILIDDHNMILAGHGRVEAAKMSHIEHVPSLRISHMSEQDKRAYILADNKLALNAGWDEELLSQELEYLIEDCPDIDIDLTGFSIAEIDEIIDIGGVDAKEESEEDDALPALNKYENIVTQEGDLWCLGSHRLLCGNALEEESYITLLGDKKAEMIIIDPPYNVKIDGHVMGKGQHKHKEFAMASGEMNQGEFTDFLKTLFGHLAHHSIDGSIHFIYMDWRHMQEMLTAGEEIYTELKNLCVWAKDQGGMGSFYRSRHELVFVFKNGHAPHINSFELGQHGRYRTNIWNYKGITSGTKTAREELAMHPTVKPVAMIADALKDCSRPGGIILDSCAGSGTILIAAEKTKRHAHAIEIDPHYCDIAIERWQNYAHDDAIHMASGKTFNQIKNEGGL